MLACYCGQLWTPGPASGVDHNINIGELSFEIVIQLKRSCFADGRARNASDLRTHSYAGYDLMTSKGKGPANCASNKPVRARYEMTCQIQPSLISTLTQFIGLVSHAVVHCN